MRRAVLSPEERERRLRLNEARQAARVAGRGRLASAEPLPDRGAGDPRLPSSEPVTPQPGAPTGPAVRVEGVVSQGTPPAFKPSHLSPAQREEVLAVAGALRKGYREGASDTHTGTVGAPNEPLERLPAPSPSASTASAGEGRGVHPAAPTQLLFAGLAPCRYCGGPTSDRRAWCSGACRKLASRWNRGEKVSRPPHADSALWSAPRRGRLERAPRPALVPPLASDAVELVGTSDARTVLRDLARTIAAALERGPVSLTWSLRGVSDAR